MRTLGLRYHKDGIESFATESRKGGNNRLMNEQQAAEFFKQFEDEAKNGKMITVEKFAEKLDEATGKKRSSLSTAYSFLHRHGWRKVMPRSKHPNKANEAEIEASKKLTLVSRK